MNPTYDVKDQVAPIKAQAPGRANGTRDVQRPVGPNHAHLGRTGLVVSRIALGTMNFGELTDEATSFRIMDTAVDAGINFFDTADVYGGPQSPDMAKGYGTSEEIIGRWLAQGGGRRDKIVLATKVYQPMDRRQCRR